MPRDQGGPGYRPPAGSQGRRTVSIRQKYYNIDIRYKPHGGFIPSGGHWALKLLTPRHGNISRPAPSYRPSRWPDPGARGSGDRRAERPVACHIPGIPGRARRRVRGRLVRPWGGSGAGGAFPERAADRTVVSSTGHPRPAPMPCGGLPPMPGGALQRIRPASVHHRTNPHHHPRNHIYCG